MDSNPSTRRSTSPDEDPPDETLSEDAISRRKNVRTACVICKRRKLKVLKRKLDSLDDKGRLLDRLVLTLQESDKTCAAQIINLIRSHGTLDELRAFIDDIMERTRPEKTPELIEVCADFKRLHESEKSNRRLRPDPKELSDILLFRVPAFPWTTVIEDDDFVSHLLSLWFTWSHPFLNWIDKDLFLRDMRSKDQNSSFCSPFLVNIILADACAYSEYPESYAIGKEMWSRGLHFYKEAKRLLDQMEGRFTVADVQGLGVLYVCQLAFAVNELAQKHKPPPPGADKETLRHAKVVELAIWGLFDLASMTAVAYQKRGLIEVPKVPFLPFTRDRHRDKWVNYPLLTEETRSHNQCIFRALCEMSLITYDLSWSLFGEGKRKFDADFIARTEKVHSRLREWHKELPACLATTDAAPQVLSVQFVSDSEVEIVTRLTTLVSLKYHTIVQTIFGLLKNLPGDEELDDEASWVRETRQRARDICVEAAQENGRLIDLHRELWGLDQMPPVNIHWVTVSMFTLLDHLEDKASREALVKLSIAAKAFSHRWALGKGMLRLFQVTSKQMEAILPGETDALFTDFEARFWTAEDRKIFSSQYPNFANSMKHGEVDDIELDSYLAKFDELHIPADDDDAPIPESHIGSEEEMEDDSGEGEDVTDDT
ncbi:hypothetical protein N7492_003801 [Penicillium capsulatum]|uniref:Transcription factor domain-containing protein n=1 Tax=Penicillium capsulatum TaxID=69766 RepID=A0A9W9INQ3_9EURO|nr:hypothetical protein N7492_003801 [Penicillium capsulatum]KAJ6121615.1 hypothetical protein N7512_004080 [Penicillium capsulatum]